MLIAIALVFIMGVVTLLMGFDREVQSEGKISGEVLMLIGLSLLLTTPVLAVIYNLLRQ